MLGLPMSAVHRNRVDHADISGDDGIPLLGYLAPIMKCLRSGVRSQTKVIKWKSFKNFILFPQDNPYLQTYEDLKIQDGTCEKFLVFPIIFLSNRKALRSNELDLCFGSNFVELHAAFGKMWVPYYL